MEIPFGIQSARGRSQEATTERSVNCYVEIQDPRAKSKLIARSRPGMSTFATLGSHAIRGEVNFQGFLYVVSDTTVYRLAANGVPTSMIGTVPGTGTVMMVAGRQELVILNEDGDGYVCDGLNITQITDPDFGSASSVDYIDGYFIFSRPDSDEWFLSGLVDATSYDALDFASKQSAPDNLVRVFVQGSNVFLCGTETIEPWINNGDVDFPFGRVGQAFIEQGLRGSHAICKGDNTFFWQTNKGMIYRANGFTGEKVSTPAVDAAIADYDNSDACEAYSYVFEGHTFIIFHYPGEGTWGYDAATKLWHELTTYGQPDWRVRDPIMAFDGRTFVGSRDTGEMLEIESNLYADAGELFEKTLISPLVHSFPNDIQMDRLEIGFERGVGLLSGQGSDPQVTLYVSDDVGNTWSNGLPASIGVQGDRGQTARAVWNSLGQFERRCFKITFADPCKFIALSADAVVKEIKKYG